MTATYTTPAGQTIHTWKMKHKRGMLTAFSTKVGGMPLLVLYSNNRIVREHTGHSHSITTWNDGDIALGGRENGVKGEGHAGLAATRRAALALIDTMKLPENACSIHPAQPNAASEGQPERCTHCLETARAMAERLTRETA